MVAYLHSSNKPAVWGIRLFTCLLAAWIWFLPQAMNSVGVKAVCDEYEVPAPVPAGEEEEVKHSKLANPVSCGADSLPPKPPIARAPHSGYAPLSAALEEVPYPPPRG